MEKFDTVRPYISLIKIAEARHDHNETLCELAFNDDSFSFFTASTRYYSIRYSFIHIMDKIKTDGHIVILPLNRKLVNTNLCTHNKIKMNMREVGLNKNIQILPLYICRDLNRLVMCAPRDILKIALAESPELRYLFDICEGENSHTENYEEKDIDKILDYMIYEKYILR